MNDDPTRVVLAFSGGLDTSYCLLDLRNRGYEVHTAFVNTGGIDDAGVAEIESRALELGATRHHTIDAAESLWNEFVIPLVWAHGRVSDEYPLLCSDRYIIVRKCLELADEVGARLFAHGCTAMGNDQLRFDQTVRSLSTIDILAPIRELQGKTKLVRDYEIDALERAGFDVPAANRSYSINENLLGVTISGQEIDRFEAPARATRALCKPRQEWPEESLTVRIGFSCGVAETLDDRPMQGPAILAALNKRCGAYGVGRHIYTGDVTIGLKGRIVFECPGIDALLIAHKALEDATNTRLQNQFRYQVAKRWSELVYTGFFYEPHKFDLEAYLESSQQHVNGIITLQSDGGVLLPVAIESEDILSDPEAVYAQNADWTPEEANGFIKLTGQSSTLSARLHGPATGKNG